MIDFISIPEQDDMRVFKFDPISEEEKINIQKNQNMILLYYLINFKNRIDKEIEQSTKCLADHSHRINKIGLYSSDIFINMHLNYLFMRADLKFYDSYGIERDPNWLIKSKLPYYRFRSYVERLKFVNELINKLENNESKQN